MTNPLVSIIMPAYNAAPYIKEAIRSVLEQEHQHLELIIVDDGSTDDTESIILSFTDSRIRYFSQENKGVSAARNLALTRMKGQFLCFLDADDVLPVASISSRVKLFRSNVDVDFIDGTVQKMDEHMNGVVSIWEPGWAGNPLEDLVALTCNSFFGLSWMIRRKPGTPYVFREGLSHGEDLLFCMELARSGGLYTRVPEVIYKYRVHPSSAMANISALAAGYEVIENILASWHEVTATQLKHFRKRYRSFLWKSYLKKGQIYKTVQYLF